MSRFKVHRANISGTNSAGTTGRIDMRSFAAGSIKIAAGTGVAFYAAPNMTATPKAIHDKNDSPVALTITADKWVPIPDECFGVLFLVPVLSGVSSGDIEVMLGD